MSEQNKDGTWRLPDEKVSPVWQEDSGALIRLCVLNKSAWREVYNGAFIQPQTGRWLPWTPPTFPVRKKNPVRLCIADFHGIRKTAAWSEGRLFEFVTNNEGYKASVVKNIEWLTPEYEDEVT